MIRPTPATSADSSPLSFLSAIVRAVKAENISFVEDQINKNTEQIIFDKKIINIQESNPMTDNIKNSSIEQVTPKDNFSSNTLDILNDSFINNTSSDFKSLNFLKNVTEFFVVTNPEPRFEKNPKYILNGSEFIIIEPDNESREKLFASDSNTSIQSTKKLNSQIIKAVSPNGFNILRFIAQSSNNSNGTSLNLTTSLAESERTEPLGVNSVEDITNTIKLPLINFTSIDLNNFRKNNGDLVKFIFSTKKFINDTESVHTDRKNRQKNIQKNEILTQQTVAKPEAKKSQLEGNSEIFIPSKNGQQAPTSSIRKTQIFINDKFRQLETDAELNKIHSRNINEAYLNNLDLSQIIRLTGASTVENLPKQISLKAETVYPILPLNGSSHKNRQNGTALTRKDSTNIPVTQIIEAPTRIKFQDVEKGFSAKQLFSSKESLERESIELNSLETIDDIDFSDELIGQPLLLSNDRRPIILPPLLAETDQLLPINQQIFHKVIRPEHVSNGPGHNSRATIMLVRMRYSRELLLTGLSQVMHSNRRNLQSPESVSLNALPNHLQHFSDIISQTQELFDRSKIANKSLTSKDLQSVESFLPNVNSNLLPKSIGSNSSSSKIIENPRIILSNGLNLTQFGNFNPNFSSAPNLFIRNSALEFVPHSASDPSESESITHRPMSTTTNQPLDEIESLPLRLNPQVTSRFVDPNLRSEQSFFGLSPSPESLAFFSTTAHPFPQPLTSNFHPGFNLPITHRPGFDLISTPGNIFHDVHSFTPNILQLLPNIEKSTPPFVNENVKAFISTTRNPLIISRTPHPISLSTSHSKFNIPISFHKKQIPSILSSIPRLPFTNGRQFPSRVRNLGLPRPAVETQCDGRQKPKCAKRNDIYCIQDPYYPRTSMQQGLSSASILVEQFKNAFLATAPGSLSSMVSSVPRKREKKFDYKYYNPGLYDVTHWLGSEGYVCPSSVYYTQPMRAQNTRGQWQLIVQNLSGIQQPMRIEKCLHTEAPCRLVGRRYKSRCVQKYALLRLLAQDPCDSSASPFIDTFKIPSSCACFAGAFG